MKLRELFTAEEVARAEEICAANLTPHEQLLREIVEPAMPRIDAATGQANDASYMAYVLEFIVSGTLFKAPPCA